MAKSKIELQRENIKALAESMRKVFAEANINAIVKTREEDDYILSRDLVTIIVNGVNPYDYDIDSEDVYRARAIDGVNSPKYGKFHLDLYHRKADYELTKKITKMIDKIVF